MRIMLTLWILNLGVSAQEPTVAPAPADWTPYVGFWRGALIHGGSTQILEVDIMLRDGVPVAALTIPDWIFWPAEESKPAFEDDQLILDVGYGLASMTLDSGRDEMRGYLISKPQVIVVHLKRVLRDPKLRVIEKEIRFDNGDVKFAATVTLPSWPGPHPAIVWIPTRGEHVRLAQRARLFASHGVASIDWDKRGCGGSDGKLEDATFADLAGDAMIALRTLAAQEGIDKNQIGLHGSGAGGWITIRIAASSDVPVRFVVTYLAPGTSVRQQHIDSVRTWMAREAYPEPIIADALEWVRLLFEAEPTDDQWESYSTLLRRAEDQGWHALFDSHPTQREQFATTWVRRHAYDPAADLARIRNPWLAILGEFDAVVPADSNRNALLAALSANPDLTCLVIPEWQHGQYGWELEQREPTDNPFDCYLVWEKASAAVWQTQFDWILARVRRSPACPLR